MWNEKTKVALFLLIVGLITGWKFDGFSFIAGSLFVLFGTLTFIDGVSVPREFALIFGFKPKPPRRPLMGFSRYDELRVQMVKKEMAIRAKNLDALCELETKVLNERLTIHEAQLQKRLLKVVAGDIKLAKESFWHARWLAQWAGFQVGKSYKDHLPDGEFAPKAS